MGRKRIGIVGYNVPTGIGELNRQMAEYADVDHWLVKPHNRRTTLAPHPDVDTTSCPNGRKISPWLSKVDVVVFPETPFYKGLPVATRYKKKRSVCIPMQEWFPKGGGDWAKLIDLFLCPTEQCYQKVKPLVRDAVLFPWPVDTDRFKFTIRKKANRFLFINGHGGVNGRKGAKVISGLIRLWPEVPLTIVSQSRAKWPTGQNVSVKRATASNTDLYRLGDVLVSPHSIDGIGLEPMEAMSSGMPVISTKGCPWNEVPAIGRVNSTAKRYRSSPRHQHTEWYSPDVKSLLEVMRGIHETDIKDESGRAREWAESQSWDSRASEFNNVVRGER
jgi:hypothetical protein